MHLGSVQNVISCGPALELIGPPNYKETYIKVRNIIKRNSEDSEMLLKEFKWEKFVENMFNCLSNIFNRINKFYFINIIDGKFNSPNVENKASHIFTANVSRSERIFLLNFRNTVINSPIYIKF